MALVAYSDSEGSDNDEPQKTPAKVPGKATPAFSIDKSNPGTIRVNLQRSSRTNENESEEPAAKKPRTGPGAFSGFNSMLPAPKRDSQAARSSEVQHNGTRKLFSLKTGAEASFSRESDTELRNSFANEAADKQSVNLAAKPAVAKPAFAKPAAPAPIGTPFMFKPLSVSRTGKKKKTTASLPPQPPTLQRSVSNETKTSTPAPAQDPVNKKISLFSSGSDEIPEIPYPDLQSNSEGYDNIHNQDEEEEGYSYEQTSTMSTSQPQSLDSIASDLNLSAAQRRQLFGRSSQQSASAVNVVNFNTDDEYAANQALIAAGETVQHNPVRAIAPGKHSLRQLVNAAAGQKDALEESFAEGKRNKKEAGNKYGW